MQLTLTTLICPLTNSLTGYLIFILVDYLWEKNGNECFGHISRRNLLITCGAVEKLGFTKFSVFFSAWAFL